MSSVARRVSSPRVAGKRDAPDLIVAADLIVVEDVDAQPDVVALRPHLEREGLVELRVQRVRTHFGLALVRRVGSHLVLQSQHDERVARLVATAAKHSIQVGIRRFGC